ncbi:Uncharacterised protein [Raoultella terrigena]|uniref:Glycosyltransferase subfamily 4-like N-terminal domain-containing protein n=1 Tax=Raoultella terrigena TaxID=577 RepID=A0A4U9D2A5_RAOTE|nr:Uncharacterised protein [Raoultella terrigena]
MKIIYINGRFLTQKITGVQRFAYELVLHLSRLRSDVVILVPGLLLINNEYSIKELNIQELVGGNGHFWEQVTLPLFLRSEKSHLLVNLCNTGPAFYKKQIVTQHDISYVRYPSSFSKRFRMFYLCLTPFLLRNSKAVVTVSNFSKKEIVDFYKHEKNNVFVIPNAVGEQFYVDSIVGGHTSDYFLTVSSISYHKNIIGLVQAIFKK